jgi:hypothetical protein
LSPSLFPCFHRTLLPVSFFIRTLLSSRLVLKLEISLRSGLLVGLCVEIGGEGRDRRRRRKEEKGEVSDGEEVEKIVGTD